MLHCSGLYLLSLPLTLSLSHSICQYRTLSITFLLVSCPFSTLTFFSLCVFDFLYSCHFPSPFTACARTVSPLLSFLFLPPVSLSFRLPSFLRRPPFQHFLCLPVCRPVLGNCSVCVNCKLGSSSISSSTINRAVRQTGKHLVRPVA